MIKAFLDLIEWAIKQDVFTPALFLAICLKEAINRNNQKDAQNICQHTSFIGNDAYQEFISKVFALKYRYFKSRLKRVPL